MGNKLIPIELVSLLVLASFLGIVTINPMPAQGTDVSGIILPPGMTWTTTGSPYIVVGDVTVTFGATLTIEPGVEVRFDGFYNIIVDGTLLAIGTETDRINFTSNLAPPTPGNWDRIEIDSLGHAEIKYCNISYSDNGIVFDSSSNNVVSDNNLYSNHMTGIYLHSSSNNNISNNNFEDYGVYIDGDQLEHFNTHTIPDNNMVNGKPLRYYTNCIDINIDGDSIEVGELILANCTNIDARNLHINNSYVGVEVAYSTNIRITNNDFLNNTYGIWLYSSSYNNITDNNVSDSVYGIILDLSSYNNIIANNVSSNINDGISLWSSSNNNTLAGNDVFDHWLGIRLYTSCCDNVITGNTVSFSVVTGILMDTSSNDNIVIGNNVHNNQHGISAFASADSNILAGNTVWNNEYGIRVVSSSNNRIFHNNLINNAIQGFDDSDNANQWDTGYPSGGNYWNDWTTPDDNSGPGQNEPGSDGIVDDPYLLDGGTNQDNYPFTTENGWVKAVYNVDTYEYFDYIQDAIDDLDTENGHTIEVSSGTYNEDVIINKGISLIGENRNTTIIDAGGFADVIHVTRDWVMISGFTITGSGFIFNDSGVDVRSENVSIFDNNIIDNRFGVYLHTYGNSIVDNNISFNSQDGILLRDSHGNNISGNTIYSNNYDGIYLESSNDNTIISNNISGNQYGLFLDNSEGNNVVNNTIHNNDWGIPIGESQNNNIIGNNIFSHIENGINLQLSSGNDITGNTLSLNNYGIYLTQSSLNRIFHNNLIDNTNQAYDDGVNSWNEPYPSGGNFWNDWTIPDDNSGPGQDELGSDGVVDNPYPIDGGLNADNYPYTTENGWVTLTSGPVHNIDTDEYFDSIQKAIDDPNTNDGHTIEVSSGVYYENVVVNKTLTLVGEDRDTAIIDGGGSGDVIKVVVDWVNISGFTVQNGDNGIILEFSSNNTICNNNAISNNRYGIYIFWEGNDNLIMNNNVHSNDLGGIFQDMTWNNDITFNNVSYNGNGLLVWFSTNTNITNNDIYSNTENGTYFWAVVRSNIKYNNISNHYHGISVDFFSDDNNIYHNNFIDNTIQAYDGCSNYWNDTYPSGGNFWSDWTAPDDNSGPGQDEPGSDGIVDDPFLIDGGSNQDRFPFTSENGWVRQPVHNINSNEYFDTIQEAIDDSDTSDGHTIEVSSRTYYENVVVNKSLSLVGENRDTTLIDGGGSGVVVNVSTNWVNITGFTIIGSGNSYRDAGIYLDNIHNCTINNTNVSSNDWGIIVSFCSNVMIINNLISWNEIVALYLESSSYCHLIDNEVTNNENGIMVESSTYNNITGNNVSFNDWHSIELWDFSDHNVIDGNTMYSNFLEGIALDTSSNNIIKNNNISLNEMGIGITSSSNNRIYHNNIIDNTNQAYDDGTNFWDDGYPSGGNYWSDWTTPDDNRGPDQDQPGSDGIVDNPREISGGSCYDNYPFATENGWVNLTPGPVHNIDKNIYYHTIQNAIDDADFGNTIIVGNGTYYERITVNKTISLIGEDPDRTFIDGGSSGDTVTVTADWVNITRLTILYRGYSTIEAALRIESDNNTVSENILSANTNGRGINLDHSHRNTIVNNTALNSNVGMVISYSNENNISRNTVLDNRIGIYLSFSEYNDVHNNTVSSNDDDGIRVDFSNRNNITANNVFSNQDYGIYLSFSSRNRINKNNAHNNGDGIYLRYSDRNNISENNASYNRMGIHLDNSMEMSISGNIMLYDSIFISSDSLEDWNTHTIDSSNTVNGKPVYYMKDQNMGTVPVNAGEIILANCDNFMIEGQTLTYGSVGLLFGFSSQNSIRDITVSYNDYGIYLHLSSGNIISGINATHNGVGIRLTYSSQNEITNNNISDNGYGIYQFPCSRNYILCNMISHNTRGIYVNGGNRNKIDDNNVSHNIVFGINLHSTANNEVTNNTVYMSDQEGIYLDFSNDNYIYNNTVISNNLAGISLYVSNSNLLSDNHIQGNERGFYLRQSTENDIINNDLLENIDGFHIRGSSNNNMIMDNNISLNDNGLYLLDSHDNYFINNTFFSNTDYGLYLESTSNNRIFHNNILHNLNQAYDDGGTNIWNDTYPSGGNYWSNYVGVDEFSGPDQDQPGSDGIGDINYTIDNDSVDHYPLMEPFIYIPGPVHNLDTDEYFDTIQQAIDDPDTINGHTIFISSGTYNESVWVNKTLTLIGENRDTTIIDGNGASHAVLITATWVNITGFTVINGINGIDIDSSSNNSITNNNLSSNNNFGLDISFSPDNTIISNNLSSNGWAGIGLWDSSNNIIQWNNMSFNGWEGILIGYSNNNIISNNNISNNDIGISVIFSINNDIISNLISSNMFDGIYLLEAHGNNLRENMIHSNDWLGIFQMDSTGNTFTGNTMVENGIFMQGYLIEHWSTHDIDTTNTVNGKPVRYWKNRTGGIVPSGAGQVILANCTGVTVRNQEIIKASLGIQLGFSSNNFIRNNIVTNNEYGIYLYESHGNNIDDNSASNNMYGISLESSNFNVIENNMIFSNTQEGISLYWSLDNTITGNMINNNGDGIYLVDSHNNLISYNNVTENTMGLHLRYSDGINITYNDIIQDNLYGIYFFQSNWNNITYNNISSNLFEGFYIRSSSNDNRIYHNNIDDSAYDECDNIWDDGYPSGGNYWSYYSGEDIYSGPGQNEPGSDGIGDDPHSISGGENQDDYPYVNQNGWLSPPGSGPVHNLDKGGYYEGIQEAIDDANQGNRIFVGSGTYYENLVIDISLILIGENRDTTIIDGGGVGDVVYISADTVSISGFTIRNSGPNGMPRDAGIEVNYADFATISNNKFNSNRDAIYLYNSEGSTITDNIIEDFDGIHIELSSTTLISNNILSNDYKGIYLDASTFCELTDNSMTGDGIIIGGTAVENWNTHTIDTTNTINGDPVHYWKDRTGGTVPYGAGQVILANSKYVNVVDQDISGCYVGILLGFSSENEIRDNDVSLNEEYGIYLYNSNDNLIENNIASDSDDGISLSFSDGNNLTANSLSDNANGIILLSSNGNTLADNILSNNIDGIIIVLSDWNNITNNEISNNLYGIYLAYSSNNVIYHNSIVDNTDQAYDDRSDNYWDNGYPVGGNFWSDYSGVDQYYGHDQDQPGKDGLGDEEYEIDSGSIDHYPLIEWPKREDEPPVIVLVSPLNNVISPGIIINFSVSDPNLDEVSYSKNSASPQILPPPYEIDTSGWDDGSYYIDITANDLFDNANTQSYLFILDSTPPSLELISDVNNTVIKPGVDIEISVDDVSTYYVYYIRNTGPVKTLPSPYEVNTSTWDEGNYIITITAIDEAENSNWFWINLTIDSSPPEISLITPFNNTMILEPRTIDFEVSDEHLKKVTCKLNQESSDPFEPPYDLDTTNWDDGTYRITIIAEDEAGWTSERWYEFMLDTSPPSVSSSSISNNAEDIDINEEIMIHFSEPMDTETVESAFSTSPYVQFDLAWSNDDKTLKISFPQGLEQGTTYRIMVGTKATDLAERSLEDRYDISFATKEKEEDEEFPLMLVLLPMILALIALFVIIALLAVRKKRSAGGIAVTPPEQASTAISCPGCSYNFQIASAYGPTQVQCPNCGLSGTMDFGGAAPPAQAAAAPKEPAKKSLKIKCPGCENLFIIEKREEPMIIRCPHCGLSGKL